MKLVCIICGKVRHLQEDLGHYTVAAGCNGVGGLCAAAVFDIAHVEI